MDIDEITTFLSIVENKGILKAAEHLFISQSTVSNRLASLEEKLHTRLIERKPGQKMLALTKQGEEFLLYAREIAHLSTVISEWSLRTHRERLRIGSIDSISGALLKDFYAGLSGETDLLLEISTHWTDRIFDLLENQHLDIGIVPRLLHSKKIITKPLFQERMVCVSRRAMSPEVDPRDLDPSLEIYFDWGTDFIVWHRQHFPAVIPPKMIVDITSLLFNALNIPGSWAFVPLSVALGMQASLTFSISDLKESPPKRTAYLAYSLEAQSRKTSAFHVFQEQLVQYLQTLSPSGSGSIDLLL